VRRLADYEAEEVFSTGFSSRIPKSITRKAHTRMRLLVAASTLQDVAVMGRIARWSKRPGRYGIPIAGKWFVTFSWEDGFGAFEVRLERC